MISHVAFVAVAEIGADILRPLIGFRQQQLAGRVGVELRPDLLDDRVGLRKVLVIGALALAEIGNGIEPESVDANVEPSPHHLHQRKQYPRGLSKFRSGWCEKKRCQ